MGKILKVIIACLLPAALMAGGTTGADILKVETGARAVAMGGAYAAAGGDSESMAYNPAGLASVTTREFSAAHEWSFDDVQVEKGAYAQPLETALIEGNVGLYGIYRHLPTISNADAPDAPISYYDFLVKAAYASNLGKLNLVDWDFAKSLNVGVSVDMVIEQMTGTNISYNGSSLALDLGAQYELGTTGFKFGAAINNLGLNITYNGSAGSAPLPLTLRAGGAYTTNIDKHNKLTAAFDYIQNVFDYPRLAAGLEDVLLGIVSVRVGYNSSIDTRNVSYFSAGTGVRIDQPGLFTVIFDYTYRPAIWGGLNTLENTHILSLQVLI
jgi:hypothetical protein